MACGYEHPSRALQPTDRTSGASSTTATSKHSDEVQAFLVGIQWRQSRSTRQILCGVVAPQLPLACVRTSVLGLPEQMREDVLLRVSSWAVDAGFILTASAAASASRTVESGAWSSFRVHHVIDVKYGFPFLSHRIRCKAT